MATVYGDREGERYNSNDEPVEHTYEARELMRLPVPNSDGMIRMQVTVNPNGGPNTVETRWLTITFEQFAQIQNVLDNL
jgi:hypothetical protein